MQISQRTDRSLSPQTDALGFPDTACTDLSSQTDRDILLPMADGDSCNASKHTDTARSSRAETHLLWTTLNATMHCCLLLLSCCPAAVVLLSCCCGSAVVLLSNAHPYSSCSHASLGLSILQLVAAGVRGVAPSDPMPCIDTFAMHWVPHTHTATASHSTCAAAWLGASHLVWEPFPRHLSIKKKVTIHQVS